MAGRASGIAFRIVTILCGLVTLFTAVPYALLQGEDMPVQSEWVFFVAALGLVGIFGFVMGVLPRRRIAKVFRVEPGSEQLFSTPLKIIGWFAAAFYLIAGAAYFVPHTWNLNPQLMLAICPMYLIKMTFDPSPVAVFLLLAPMNAAAFGAFGLAASSATSGVLPLSSRTK